MNVYLTNLACEVCHTALELRIDFPGEMVYSCPRSDCSEFYKRIKAPLYPVEEIME